jgi:spore maturation protein CgeB
MKMILKKFSMLNYINAQIKSRKMESELSKIEFKLNKLEIRHLDRVINKTVRKIFWIGGSYHQDHSGYMQSLAKIVSASYFVQSNGSYGLIKQPSATTRLIFDEIASEHEEQIINCIENEKPDLVMGQMWASTISLSLLKKIRAKGIPVINIAMDDKLPYHWQIDKDGRRNGAIGLAAEVDLTLNTTRLAAEWYEKLGFPCLYWPLAGDPAVFFPRPKKIYDVVFIGSKYGYRGELIQALINAGVNVATFGPGWPSGPCTAMESAEIFGSAKIILGIGYIGHSKKLVTLKQRDFDALFTGGLYITTRNPDLEDILVDGEHVVYYDDKSDMVNKVIFYLKNESKRQEIICKAMEEGLKKHTWDIRLRDTFNKIGLRVSDTGRSGVEGEI